MPGDVLTALPLEQIVERIHSGELSPLELTEAYLERIDALNPTLNAFIHLDAKAALRASAERGREAAAGNLRGSLHGVPLAVKDLIDVAGMPTTAGTVLFGGRRITQSADVIANLEQQGAVIIGKTHLQELVLGATNANPHYGAARNPWNPAYSPGGSSGGSGAAVAAGMCPAALGTDTSGSVRLPAALCGLTGLRPPTGLVSTAGVMPRSHVLDTVGPLAHTAKGTALLLDAMVGGAGYAARLDAPPGLRIGLVGDDAWHGVEPDVVDPVRGAVEVLEKQGMTTVAVDLQMIGDAVRAVGVIGVVDVLLNYGELVERHADRVGDYARARLDAARAHEAVDYADAIRVAQAWKRRLREVLTTTVDVLITPATPTAAHPIGPSAGMDSEAALPRFTYPFSLGGLPALSAPCGFSGDGMPVGMQIIAADTATALQVAYLYQRHTAWHTRRAG